MNKQFDGASYLSQVRKLRSMAIDTLRQYPIRSYDLKFINHGENTTFKVLTKKRDYLLRIHCRSYRTKESLLEELRWLKYLSQYSDIPVQRPVLSINNRLVEVIDNNRVGHPRFCDILEWQDGHIKNKKTPLTYYEVGKLIGKLQTKTIRSKHRNYWDTQGLVGQRATLGAVGALKNDFPKYHLKLEELRKTLFRQLMRYEKRNRNKLTLIHGDLHFGNMIWNGPNVKPIDFDDCGVGLEMYDLAVTLAQSSNYFKKVGKKDALLAKHKLLEGYCCYKNLSKEDIKVLPYLVAAREIAMVGWLYGRRDNPELWQHLKKNIAMKVRRTDFYINQAEKGIYLQS